MPPRTSKRETATEDQNAIDNLDSQAQSLPFSDLDSDEVSSIAGCLNTRTECLPFSNSTWNILANGVMKQLRQARSGTKKERLDIKLFLDLPLDLILEIAGHLHPIDIYHITQTSKTLRNIVLARDSISLWKTCFARYPRIPQCPPGVSEHQWTILMFGPAVCNECGKLGALPDFAFRRRLCSQCLSYPDLDICVSRAPHQSNHVLYEQNNIIWDLVPATHRTGGNNYWGDYKPEQVREIGQYLHRELRVTAQKLEELRKDLDQDVPGAKEKLEAFEWAARTRASQIIEHAGICTTWALDIFDKVMDESFARPYAVKERVKSRMVALGHDPEDVDSIELHNFLFYGKPIIRLTRRVWRDIRPVAESIIADQKERRRLAARKILLDTRGQVIKSAYLQYQRSLASVMWSTMPDYEELLEYEAFSALLNDTSDAELTAVACIDAITKIPGYLANWREQKLRHLLAQLPEKNLTNLDDPTLLIPRLRLATSIFTCVDCKTKNTSGICLFGWEDVSVHVRCATLLERGLGSLVYNTKGSGVAAALVLFLGLDPSTASAAGMDRLNARLICARCPVRSYRGVRGHAVYTWREYITHVLHGDTAHSTDAWHLLTPEVTALIRLHEDTYPHPWDKAWSCNHCSVHFGAYVSRKDAVKHVKDIHSIPMPVEGTDIIYQSGPETQHTRRRPVAVGGSPPTELVCAQCPGRGNRLYSALPLGQHLLDKHEISSPVLGTDFVKFDIIHRSSDPV